MNRGEAAHYSTSVFRILLDPTEEAAKELAQEETRSP